MRTVLCKTHRGTHSCFATPLKIIKIPIRLFANMKMVNLPDECLGRWRNKLSRLANSSSANRQRLHSCCSWKRDNAGKRLEQTKGEFIVSQMKSVRNPRKGKQRVTFIIIRWEAGEMNAPTAAHTIQQTTAWNYNEYGNKNELSVFYVSLVFYVLRTVFFSFLGNKTRQRCFYVPSGKGQLERRDEFASG